MLLIARRYLFSKKSHSVVNIISVVSLFSLLIPVAAVIVLLSVFNGFGALVGSLDEAVEADLTLLPREGRLFAEEDVDSVALRKVRGVEALSYITEQMLLVEYRGENQLLTFRGVDQSYTDVIEIEPMLISGRFETELGDLDRVVLGNSIVRKLGVRSFLDAELRLYSLRTGRLYSMLPIGGAVERAARLSGAVMLDEESEMKYGYTSRRLVNELTGREGSASKVVIKVANGADRESVKRSLQGVVGDRFRVMSREELNPALYEIVRFEKLGVLLISSMVMLLATFSLVGALAMLIIEKQADMRTLRAMGATRGLIKRIFIIEGALISGVAIGAGVVLGVVVTLLQQHVGFVRMPSSTLFGSIYPVELQVSDVASVVVIAAVISSALSYVVVSVMLRRGE